jgi:hypothetical protein
MVMTITTPTDVRALLEKHLPAEYRAEFTWRQLTALPCTAAKRVIWSLAAQRTSPRRG